MRRRLQAGCLSCREHQDMYRIDETNLFEKLGPKKIVDLSGAFYRRVYADPDPWFREMFPEDMHHAVRNQYEFFIQRLGGPALYSERKGHPALRARHKDFPITERAVGRWLKHMRDALDEVGIAGDDAEHFWEYLKDTAHFMQNQDRDGNRIY